MSPPIVLINTYLKACQSNNVDYCSKIMIIVKWIFGVNLLKTICISTKNAIPYYLYSMFLYIYLSYVCFIYLNIDSWMVYIVIYSKYIQLMFCAMMALFTSRIISCYFKKLKKLDEDIGVTLEVPRMSYKLLVVLFVEILAAFSTVVFIHNKIFFFTLFIIHSVQASECIFCGHLIILTLARLRLVNDSLQISLSKKKRKPDVKISVNINGCLEAHMKRLLIVYRSIINIHRLIVKATQWQMLIIIITGFVFILSLAHSVTRNLVRNEYSSNIVLFDLMCISLEMIALIVPCMSNDALKSEVERFRELLASKLYGNDLEKSSRSTARVLLSLTKNRNLSFYVLRMIDVSVSLPFKFIGIIGTYLIILLQFEKVLYP